MNEHAPGQWIYTGNTTINREDPIFHNANVICGGKRIARVAGIGENETMANAHLIAAAPDLLVACEQIERAWVGDGVDMSVAVDACLLAIEKAKT